MKGLRRSVNGETHIFRPNGEVAVIVEGQPAVKGTWRTKVPADVEPDNLIRYDIDGAEQDPLPVHYRFNRNNQLRATIPAAANDGEDSAPFTFIGRIVIDDQHDIVYQLIDSEGNDHPRKMVVYGDLEINERANKLTIFLAGPEGGDTVIRGTKVSERTKSSVEALYNSSDFRGDDLLRFCAVTRNPLENAAGLIEKKAEIEFVGNWDVQSGRVVFSSTVKGDVNKPDVVIGLAGKFKAVSGGLIYVREQQGESGVDERLVFQIEGQHKWNATEATWDVSIGYSQKTFTAEIEGELERVGPKTGNKFTLGGTVKVESSEGEDLELDLELKATYTWQNGTFVITADVSIEEGELDYDIGLEGTFTFRSGKLTFGAKYNSEGEKAEIEVEFIGNQSSLLDSLRFVLKLEDDGEIDLEFEFTAQLSWRDGVRVLEDAVPLAA